MTEAAMEKVDEDFQHLEQGHDYTKKEYNEAVKVELPVMVAKVDCVIHKELCLEYQIFAYPTLRLFAEGKSAADYRGDRTVLEMIHWLAHVEEFHKSQIGEEKYNVLLADESECSSLMHTHLSFIPFDGCIPVVGFSTQRIPIFCSCS